MYGNLAYKEEPRIEMIDGKIIAMSPAATNHNEIGGNIFGIFWTYLRGKQCRAYWDGQAVYLTEKDMFIPDVMVVCDRSKIKNNGIYGAPDLVVEILSPSTARRDRTHKKDVYAQCGVREYWLVSPGEKSVEVYRAEDGVFVLHDIYTLRPAWMLETMTDEERAAVETHFQCCLFDDLDISLDDIFDGLLP